MPSGYVGNLDHRGSNMGSVEMSEKQGSDLAWQVMHWPGRKETLLCFSSVPCWNSGVHYPLYYSPSLLVLSVHMARECSLMCNKAPTFTAITM